jgi:hypothetical protein
MKKLLLVAVTLGLAACGDSAPPPKPAAQPAKVQAGAIDVTAQDGRVSLWGTTSTPAERNLAAQIAAKVNGVASVDNQLKVVKGS